LQACILRTSGWCKSIEGRRGLHASTTGETARLMKEDWLLRWKPLGELVEGLTDCLEGTDQTSSPKKWRLAFKGLRNEDTRRDPGRAAMLVEIKSALTIRSLADTYSWQGTSQINRLFGAIETIE